MANLNGFRLFSRKRSIMKSSQLDPENLRARAEECRTRAETFRDQTVKTKMRSIAAGYDQMATRLENETSPLSLT
jgi:hypothetical protein